MKTLEHNTAISSKYNKLLLDRFFPGVYKLLSRPEDSFIGFEKETRVFLVDDDPMYLKALESSVSNGNGSLVVNSFQTGEACLQNLKLDPDVVILDYYLNTEFPYAWNGLSILKHIKRISPTTKVIMISSQDSLAVAIDCIEKGAFDYVAKSKSAFSRINRIVNNIKGDREETSAFAQIAFFVLLAVTLALTAGFIIR